MIIKTKALMVQGRTKVPWQQFLKVGSRHDFTGSALADIVIDYWMKAGFSMVMDLQ